jgi:hypothetical protein
MNSAKSGIIVLVLSLVPYLFVSWLCAELIDERLRTFWIAFGLLIGARLFFSFIECLGGILIWRIHGREVVVQMFLRVLKENKFPTRYYQHDSFLNYLSRIEDDCGSTQELKFEVKAFEKMLLMWENSGVLAGARMHAATEIALERYSPRRLAPIMSYD